MKNAPSIFLEINCRKQNITYRIHFITPLNTVFHPLISRDSKQKGYGHSAASLHFDMLLIQIRILPHLNISLGKILLFDVSHCHFSGA